MGCSVSRAHKSWSRSFLFKDFLVLRPHYAALPKRYGSLGPRIDREGLEKRRTGQIVVFVSESKAL